MTGRKRCPGDGTPYRSYNTCGCGSPKKRDSAHCRTCYEAIRGSDRAYSIRLTPRGFAATSHDQRLLTAPCQCGAVVQVWRSGVWESGVRHACRVAA